MLYLLRIFQGMSRVALLPQGTQVPPLPLPPLAARPKLFLRLVPGCAARLRQHDDGQHGASNFIFQQLFLFLVL